LISYIVSAVRFGIKIWNIQNCQSWFHSLHHASNTACAAHTMCIAFCNFLYSLCVLEMWLLYTLYSWNVVFRVLSVWLIWSLAAWTHYFIHTIWLYLDTSGFGFKKFWTVLLVLTAISNLVFSNIIVTFLIHVHLYMKVKLAPSIYIYCLPKVQDGPAMLKQSPLQSPWISHHDTIWCSDQ
jgi:hypothetical protein